MKISNLHKLLIVLTVVLLAVAGIYFFVPARKKAPVMAINNNQNTNTNAPVVADGGMTAYSEPALGVEFQYPNSWKKMPTALGADTGNEVVFWRDILGQDFWNNSSVNITLKVKKSNLSLRDFWNTQGVGSNKSGNEKNINGYQSIVDGFTIQNIKSVDNAVSWQSGGAALIKNNDIYYFFQFSSASSDKVATEKNVVEFEKIFSTIKLSVPVK